MKFDLFRRDKSSFKEDGLPDVAQKNHSRSPSVFIVLGIILAAFLGMYLHTKSKNSVPNVIEETYTPQAQEGSDTNKKSLLASPVVGDSKQIIQEPKEVTEEKKLFIQEKQKELEQRLSAPLMLVANTPTAKLVETKSTESNKSTDPNTQFMNQVSSQESDTVHATSIGSLHSVIAEGSLIHAILEPATDSDLPGYLRAIVSEPSYSEDGSQVLIPPGSRLIGQYKSGIMEGQSRIFIVWTRLLTPAGISVELGSPGVDGLGVAGIGADEINRHFWERFGTASLLSLMGAGAANAGVSSDDQANSAAAYRAAVASSFNQSASQSLQQESMIAPTLKTYQGKPIIVFVAHDLNFQDAMEQVNPRIKVF